MKGLLLLLLALIISPLAGFAEPVTGTSAFSFGQPEIESLRPTIRPGLFADLTVSARGALPITYRWYKIGFNTKTLIQNSENSNSTQNSLHIPNPDPNSSGKYQIEVENSSGKDVRMITLNITFSINEKPTIEIEPSDVSARVGEAVMLYVQAQGSDTLHYRWFKNSTSGFEALPQSDSPVLTLSAAALDDAGLYKVEISNPYGSVSSRVVNLNVVPAIYVRSAVGGTVQLVKKKRIRPVRGARILVEGLDEIYSEARTRTRRNGRYKIKNLAPGNYQVTLLGKHLTEGTNSRHAVLIDHDLEDLNFLITHGRP